MQNGILKVRLHCLVIAQSNLPGYHENPSTSIEDAFTQLGNVPCYNASVVCSLDRVTAEEASHMLATCALVLVVLIFLVIEIMDFHRQSVSCCFDFSSRL